MCGLPAVPAVSKGLPIFCGTWHAPECGVHGADVQCTRPPSKGQPHWWIVVVSLAWLNAYVCVLPFLVCVPAAAVCVVTPGYEASCTCDDLSRDKCACPLSEALTE